MELPLAEIVVTNAALTDSFYDGWYAVPAPPHRPLPHVMVQRVVDHANLALANIFGMHASKACPELFLNRVHFGHRTKHFSFTE